jgi:hypothetical protein
LLGDRIADDRAIASEWGHREGLSNQSSHDRACYPPLRYDASDDLSSACSCSLLTGKCQGDMDKRR